MKKSTYIIGGIVLLIIAIIVLSVVNNKKQVNTFKEELEDKYNIEITDYEKVNKPNGKFYLFTYNFKGKDYQFLAQETLKADNLHLLLSNQILLDDEVKNTFGEDVLHSTLIYQDKQLWGLNKQGLNNKQFDMSIYDSGNEFFKKIGLGDNDFYQLILLTDEVLDDETYNQFIYDLYEKYGTALKLEIYYTDNQSVIDKYDDILVNGYENLTIMSFNRNDFKEVYRFELIDEQIIKEQLR